MSGYELPESITIQNASELGEAFAGLNMGEPQTLNASRTTQITTPGVQLLMALSKSLQQAGNALYITGQTAGFKAVFETLGVSIFTEGPHHG